MSDYSDWKSHQDPDWRPAKPQSGATLMDDKQALREKLAAIEHQRWSDWQKWCHQVIRENVPQTDELEAVLARWDRQIEVPYELLTDSEKASDMEQVDRYWHLIDAYTEQRVAEARIDELKRLKLSGTPEKMTDILVEVPELTTKTDVGLLSIDDRIAQLKASTREGE